jgi:hypothetical protein
MLIRGARGLTSNEMTESDLAAIIEDGLSNPSTPPMWDDFEECDWRKVVSALRSTAVEAVSDDQNFKIAKLELGPRDVLVVKTAYHISDETVARVRKYVAEQANINNAVLVIQPDLDLAVLTRDEIEERIA